MILSGRWHGFSFGEMAGSNRRGAALERVPPLIQDGYRGTFCKEL